MNKRKFITFSVLVKGFSSVIIQTLLVRELLIVFYGNELTFGIILSAWLLSGAIGAGLIGSRLKGSPLKSFCFLQLFVSFAAPLSLVLIRASKTIFGIPFGEAFSIGHILAITCTSTVLVAAVDGAMFSAAFRLLSENKKEDGSHLAKIYLWESLGIITGGIAFTFVLLSCFNSFAIILFVSILNLLASNLLLSEVKNVPIRTLFALLLALTVYLLSLSSVLHKTTLRLQWQDRDLVAYENSVYGNIAALKDKSQYTIYYDGIPAVSIPSEEMYFTEDFIHLPLLSKPSSKNILFIGHATGGLLKETLKYPVSKITYVETDPVFIRIIKSLKETSTEQELTDPKVKIEYTDGRSFLKDTNEKFDVIFVNSGLPTSLAINRYYTKEFFLEIKKVLAKRGIAVFKTWGSLTYLNQELRHINAAMLKTLEAIFPEINIIPGDGFNMFIASNEKHNLSPYIMSLYLKQYGIRTQLINTTYLELRLQKPYLDWFLNNIKDETKKTEINTDLKPTGLYDGLSLYYSQFSKKIPRLFSGVKKVRLKHIIIYVLSFFFTWRLIFRRSRINIASLNLTIFTTGLYAMSVQIITLFLFQSLLGYLFHWLAILTTSFMTGASLGAFYANKKLKSLGTPKRLITLETMIPAVTTIFTLAIVVIFKYNAFTSGITKWLFSLISISAGLLVGIELPVVFELTMKITNPWRTEPSKIAGLYYCMDLAGACAGALLIPILFIPSFGIVNSVIMLLVIKLLNAWHLFSFTAK